MTQIRNYNTLADTGITCDPQTDRPDFLKTNQCLYISKTEVKRVHSFQVKGV